MLLFFSQTQSVKNSGFVVSKLVAGFGEQDAWCKNIPPLSTLLRLTAHDKSTQTYINEMLHSRCKRIEKSRKVLPYIPKRHKTAI